MSQATARTTNAAGQFMPTHGRSKTSTYRSWRAMLERVCNPRNNRFYRYGGRGIKVCSEWHDFETFRADMGECPPAHSIDRIDNDGNYCKENCRWSSRQTQARNNSRNNLVTFEGETLPIIAWAERAGVPYKTFHFRLRTGWDFARAMRTPVVEPCEDFTGRVVDRLTVIRRSADKKPGFPLWSCRCICGTVKDVSARTLRREGLHSCGCATRERLQQYNAKRMEVARV